MSTTRSPGTADGKKAAQSPPPSPLKMSEIKPEFFTKTVRKHAGRAKERILQNLGKADRTTDEVFDDYVHNFSRQQGQATRLQKEMANYVRCARAMQAANKSLMDTIYDMYEPEWSNRENLERQARELELLWADYCHKLSDQVLEPLNTYSSQFPEVRRKVEKRGRKLVDYDSHRHNYEALQNNTKKRDQAKITKQHEVLEEARRTFEIMNNELYDELPALYDSRIPFLVSNMQTLFMAEHSFQSDASKVQLELEAVMDSLQKDSSTGKYTTRRNPPKSPKSPTAPTPASPSDVAAGDDARPLLRTGGATSGVGLKHTLSSLTKRFSARQEPRPPATRPTKLARASTFHVSAPSPPVPTPPRSAEGPASFPDTPAGGGTNPFRAASASPENQQHRRRHNPFLESPRPAAPTPPPPPVPSSPIPVTNGAGTGETILEVSPVPAGPCSLPSGAPPPLTQATVCSDGAANAAAAGARPPSTLNSAEPSSVPDTADASAVDTDTVAKSGEVESVAAADAPGDSQPAPAAAAKAEAPPKPPRTPEAVDEEAPSPPSAPPAAGDAPPPAAPMAEPEASVVSGMYPSLPSVPEAESACPASPTQQPAADGTGSIDRNKTATSSSNKEDPRPYEEISYKKENGGDFSDAVPSGAARPVNGGTKARPEELYDIPVGATTDDLPPGVLYRVKAAYKYQAEDADELSFEVAEMINVVEYEDADEQEEGWLCGVKESTGQKGLFPANFTRPI